MSTSSSGRTIYEYSSDVSFDHSTEYSTHDEQGVPQLVPEEEDPLIPRPADVQRTFNHGKVTWKAFLDQASKVPEGLWPAEALDPYVTLVDVPCLPAKLPRFPRRRPLFGRPCWEMPLDIFDDTEANHRDPENTMDPCPRSSSHAFSGNHGTSTLHCLPRCNIIHTERQ